MPYKDPEKRRAWQREAKRRTRAGKTAQKSRRTQPFRLDSAVAVRKMLERVVLELEAQQVEVATKGRILCRIGEVCLKALEQGDLETRLVELEKAISIQGGV